MPARATVDIWPAISAGDAPRVAELLQQLSPDWLRQQGESAAGLAQAKGHLSLVASIRSARARALATDQREVELQRELELDLARSRAQAFATSDHLEAGVEAGLASNRSIGVAAEGGGLRGIDPLRRMMRDDDLSSLASSRSSRSSRSSKRSSSKKGKRKKKKGGGGDDDDDGASSIASDLESLASDLTDDELLGELDDMLDAMRHDALGVGGGEAAGVSRVRFDASADAIAPPEPPPPPKQLQLSDLSVRELRVMIKALGGEADLPEGAVDKSELLAITANVLADAPLGLIDDVTAALGLSGLTDVGSRAPSRRLKLHELDESVLRTLLGKLDAAGDNAPEGGYEAPGIGREELVRLALAAVAAAPLPLLDAVAAELQLSGEAADAEAEAQIRAEAQQQQPPPHGTPASTVGAMYAGDDDDDEEAWPDLPPEFDDECWPDPTQPSPVQRSPARARASGPSALRFMQGSAAAERAQRAAAADGGGRRKEGGAEAKEKRSRQAARLEKLKGSAVDLLDAERWEARPHHNHPRQLEPSFSRHASRGAGADQRRKPSSRTSPKRSPEKPSSHRPRKSPEKPRGGSSKGGGGSSDEPGAGGGGAGGAERRRLGREGSSFGKDAGRKQRRTKESAKDGASARQLRAFPLLERYGSTAEDDINLQAAPVGAPPTLADPYDLSQLTAPQLHKILCTLVGASAAPPLVEPTGATPAAAERAKAAAHEKLSEEVRASLVTAPLALVDDVCEQITAAAAMNAAAAEAAARRALRKSKSGHGHSAHGHGGRSKEAGSSKEQGHRSKEGHRRHRRERESKESSSKEAGGSHRPHHSKQRSKESKERSLDRRIEEALNPDLREAKEARRAARHLERRIAKALMSEGYSPSPKKGSKSRLDGDVAGRAHHASHGRGHGHRGHGRHAQGGHGHARGAQEAVAVS